ncbi:beta-propeller fold lactonase family protein [Falsibacillus pallidus]|uniref:bifunctional YncE family protein/alkaline phosphatase family protein n=1 Tax=Falsibacillus pallidus TaxID=493781 RepID=UPI003D980D5C
MKLNRKKWLGAALTTLVIGSSSAVYAGYHEVAGPTSTVAGITPHDWNLTPAGQQLTLGDFPMGGAVSPDGRYLVVSNDGQGEQSLQVIDTKTDKVVQSLPYKSPQALYLGVVFSPDGKKVYASGGGSNKIRVFDFNNGNLTEESAIALDKDAKKNLYPAGLSITQDGHYLFAANNLDHSVSKINTQTQEVEKTTSVGKNPYAAYLSKDGKKLFVSNWGESSVTVLNPETMEEIKTISTGLHPNAIAENPKSGTIYVSNSDSDSISFINPESLSIEQTFSVKPNKHVPTGSQPDALTVSKDGQTLYAANAGNNDVSVIDVSGEKAKMKGLIPTAWYPTGVFIDQNENELMVMNAKGLGAGSNADGQYIGNMIKGTLSTISIPNDHELKKYSKQVSKNNEYFNEHGDERSEEGKKHEAMKSPIPQYFGQKNSPIKHVIYVIKENRTYDQVFGDLEKGNGDEELTTYGKEITPNLHKLANQFVTLDNFYADAEISAQGHNWAAGAKANDYVEKNWMANYSGRNRGYDFEGSNEAAYPKAGFLWNNSQRSGVSYRDYGEFTNYDKQKEQWVPTDPSIGTNYDPDFPGWDLSISDLTRYDAWEDEFKTYVENGNLPDLQIVRLPNDHTSGTAPGKLTPEAMVAQNDYAVGKLVDAVSHSPYWKNTGIFITEDDAQNGWDHVDAHRTESLVVSPYTQSGKLDSTFYDTTSMIKTMELILGMQPMSQFDASAIPMNRSFMNKPVLNPFEAEKPTYPIDKKNGEAAVGAAESKSIDFSQADHADNEKLNHILWNEAKKNKAYPKKNK